MLQQLQPLLILYDSTYHLVNDKNYGHKREILALSFLTKDCLKVPLKEFHDEDVVIALLAKPVHLRNAFLPLQVLQDLILMF